MEHYPKRNKNHSGDKYEEHTQGIIEAAHRRFGKRIKLTAQKRKQCEHGDPSFTVYLRFFALAASSIVRSDDPTVF